MASSNRHWPSMFKSKPTHQHHQCQSPYSSGCEERSPEPKPRWNPKPEQIRILESIFNSGMVNPPRDEIRKIRAQLQEYGPVGDANVFYWFQNRKSRSKNKNRHQQKAANHQSPTASAASAMATTSSSSSDQSSSSKSFEFLLNSPTASVNQHQHHHHQQGEFFPFFNVLNHPQGFCFPELGNGNDHDYDRTAGMLLTHHENDEIPLKKKGVGEDEKLMKMLTYTSYTAPPSPPPPTASVASIVNDIQGVVNPRLERSTVFINEVAFEVAVGPFNVREAFGADVALIHATGQPVVTDEWGVTLHPLQHGAFYYLVSSLTYAHATTIDLI